MTNEPMRDSKTFHFNEGQIVESTNADTIEVTGGQMRSSQGPLLLLVDDNQILEEDERNYNTIQYAEIEPPSAMETQITQEMRQKGEMIQQVRNQRKQFSKGNRRKPNQTSRNPPTHSGFDVNTQVAIGEAITVNGAISPSTKIKRQNHHKKIIRNTNNADSVHPNVSGSLNGTIHR